MKQNISRLILILAAGTQFLFFQNCSKVSVSDLAAESSNQIVQGVPTPQVPKCTQKLEYVTKPVKIMFLVDRSGSNVVHYDAATNKDVPGGTDNDKVWRTAVIKQVLEKYGKNPSISYGLISFNHVSATPHIKSPSGEAIFTNNMAEVYAGFNDFLQKPDESTTPYQEALFAARSAIQQDIAAAPVGSEKAAYSVVMLSDGIPSSVAYKNNPQAVIPDAQSIMDLSPGMVRLNAVFYSNETVDLNAQKFLKNISTTGQGIFLVANTNEPFVLNNLVEYAKETCE